MDGRIRLTCESNERVTALHTSRRYFSRYFGKRVANDDSSVNVPPLLSTALNSSIFHYRTAKPISNHMENLSYTGIVV